MTGMPVLASHGTSYTAITISVGFIFIIGAVIAVVVGLAAAVRGEPAGAQAGIVIVCREPGAREILNRELSKRYGTDYQIVVCDRPAELEPKMRDLLAASLPVALVIAGVGAQDRDGIEASSTARSRSSCGSGRASAAAASRRCG